MRRPVAGEVIAFFCASVMRGISKPRDVLVRSSSELASGDVVPIPAFCARDGDECKNSDAKSSATNRRRIDCVILMACTLRSFGVVRVFMGVCVISQD